MVEMTAREETLPEWLHEGAELVVMTHNRRGEWIKSRDVTVLRILKRDIVLDSGDRFSRRNISKYRDDCVVKPSSTAWGNPTYLMRRDDPRALDGEKTWQELVAANDVTRAHDRWVKDRSSDTALAQIANAVAALQEYRRGR